MDTEQLIAIADRYHEIYNLRFEGFDKYLTPRHKPFMQWVEERWRLAKIEPLYVTYHLSSTRWTLVHNTRKRRKIVRTVDAEKYFGTYH